MPARFRPPAELNAISSLHRRQHRATITVPPLKRGAEAKVPLLYRSRERVPAAPSQVDVQLANTIVRAGVAGGWNALLCHPRQLGRLARPGGRLRFGRLPVLCSGAHWQGTMSYELAHARRGLGTGGRGRSGDHGIGWDYRRTPISLRRESHQPAKPRLVSGFRSSYA